MFELIQLNAYPVNVVLKSLLIDKTTQKNIIFATNAYTSSNPKITPKSRITFEVLKGFDSYVIQPRVCKGSDEQTDRSHKKAEVFTPSWICNKMNNHCDAEWFGRDGVFNTETEQDWIPTEGPIQFDSEKTWQMYVDSRRLEITCGEAPYIVSRYDAATGNLISINKRIGILDRKLRVINENTKTETEWFKWVYRAYGSVYGYEFQGDNLLIARINLLITFVDYMQNKWKRNPTEAELKGITNIICWNLWQMDGITGTIPFSRTIDECRQMPLFDFVIDAEKDEKKEDSEIYCKIYDWRSRIPITFNSLKEGK